MTQQSMEAATKGLATVVGIPYRELLKHGHNNLHIFFLFMERVLAATPEYRSHQCCTFEPFRLDN